MFLLGRDRIKIDSYVLTEHIRAISKRFYNGNYPTKITTFSKYKMIEIEDAANELGFIN